MEHVRLTGSLVVEAEVIDRYESKESGFTYGIALVDGQRVPVVQYPDSHFWYLDVGEVIR